MLDVLAVKGHTSELAAASASADAKDRALEQARQEAAAVDPQGHRNVLTWGLQDKMEE